jgi:PAS domain S-box-containing protein
LFAFDHAGVFTLSQGKGLEAIGLRPGQVVGKSVFEVYRDQGAILSRVQRALRGEAFSETFEVRGAVFETHYAPFYDAQGTLAGVNGVAIDVTERKQAEEALRQAQAQLAHFNRVTTMGQLAASIAHEVKQPVTGVAANAHAALRFLQADPPELDEIREALLAILKNSERAADIVSRIGSLMKKTPPRHEWMDINEAVLEVIALTQDQAGRAGVALDAELAEQIPPIEGDRVQLQQVALNLIVNAIEAASHVQGAKQVVVATQQDESDGVLITVKDTGIGLEATRLDRLFEAFYTTKSSGMGMGLAICRSIIKAHGGQVWAEPNEPQGAVFRFTIPLQRQAAA